MENTQKSFWDTWKQSYKLLNDTYQRIGKTGTNQIQIHLMIVRNKIRAEISEIETILRISKSKSCFFFFEKIKKVDRPFAQQTKKKWDHKDKCLEYSYEFSWFSKVGVVSSLQIYMTLLAPGI